ncbi:hypothetical protein GGF37_003361 [Kickxella alabastrina]|nr:hypothetical protein GGF37_003361 [Kickxella alabastrina]
MTAQICNIKAAYIRPLQVTKVKSRQSIVYKAPRRDVEMGTDVDGPNTVTVSTANHAFHIGFKPYLPARVTVVSFGVVLATWLNIDLAKLQKYVLEDQTLQLSGPLAAYTQKSQLGRPFH